MRDLGSGYVSGREDQRPVQSHPLRQMAVMVKGV